ncbi:hypothetical protein [Streptomyces sp. NBC_01022]|uniref:hypothetical protein n=1 Tax=Streptomyces sp. NBC_01022 TaxID=2903723 RepID=UPI002DDA57CD|nr:hypothetical protein [Streptomyces sp. NBC_01022]WRZ84816.1 hypothetical protein OG316_33430 [Streptomyces sp. NBC_01022]
MPDTTPTLRDRIRRAICEATGFTWLPDELMEPDEYGEHADAVLAVLPAPAPVEPCGSLSQPTYSGEIMRCVLPVGHPRQCQSTTEYPWVSWPSPTAQADLLMTESHRRALSDVLGLGTGAPWDAIRDRAAELGRLADEAQPATDQHEHAWATVPAHGAYAQLMGLTWTRCTTCGQQPETEAPAPQCTAGLLPATDAAVDRCIRRGKHDSHATAAGVLWGNGSADEQPEDGEQRFAVCEFVPDTPRAPDLCATCGDSRAWHNRTTAPDTVTEATR